MTTDAGSAHATDDSTAGAARRRLLLIWQNPHTRRFSKVGALDLLGSGRCHFRYLPTDEPAFRPLAEFPDLHRSYDTATLPAFFANRVMSRRRPAYDTYRHWLGLDEPGADTPFEVLARTGGARATDTFHVVDDLRRSADGTLQSRFFASGVRHVGGADERLARLTAGTTLRLRDEPDNPVNHRAILLDADGEPVGYVPDWLVDDVHALHGSGPVEVVAEQVNGLDAPAHLRLLCRLTA